MSRSGVDTHLNTMLRFTLFCLLLSVFLPFHQLVAEPFRSFLNTKPLNKQQVALNQAPVNPADNIFLNTAEMQTFKLPGAPQLTPVDISINSRGEIFLPEIPAFASMLAGRTAGQGDNGEYVVFTINDTLQAFVEKTIKNIRASHAAIVVMEPKTGRILSIADKSVKLDNASLHAGYPAASLFKVVTSAAALEQSTLEPASVVRFRGGNYTLNKYNFNPNERYDKRSMTLAEALGKSCNPVFARVVLQHLSQSDLTVYAKKFGFNTDIAFDTPGLESPATIPASDYELSRTAAGFGAVYISPIHAASFISAVANGGYLPRPYLVDRVISKQGRLLYQATPQSLQQVVKPDTAKTLLTMMEATTTKGTSAYAFFNKKKPYLPGIRVSGKTGTLRGKNPEGLNRWFVGAAPLENPEVSVAVIVVNGYGTAARPSYIARRILQEHFIDSK